MDEPLKGASHLFVTKIVFYAVKWWWKNNNAKHYCPKGSMGEWGEASEGEALTRAKPFGGAQSFSFGGLAPGVNPRRGEGEALTGRRPWGEWPVGPEGRSPSPRAKPLHCPKGNGSGAPIRRIGGRSPLFRRKSVILIRIIVMDIIAEGNGGQGAKPLVGVWGQSPQWGRLTEGEGAKPPQACEASFPTERSEGGDLIRRL